MGSSPDVGWLATVGWLAAELAGPGRSETGWLADEDDVDAAGQFLVDLQDLPDGAVLPVGGLRPGVLEFQAVLVDPLVRRLEVRDEFLRAGDEDDIGGAPGVNTTYLRVPGFVTWGFTAQRGVVRSDLLMDGAPGRGLGVESSPSRSPRAF
jgi:hypothetical protein